MFFFSGFIHFFYFFSNTWNGHGHIRNFFNKHIYFKGDFVCSFSPCSINGSTMDCRSMGGGSIPSGEIFVFFIYVFGKLAESGFKVVVWSAIDTIIVSAGSNPALAVNYFFSFLLYFFKVTTIKYIYYYSQHINS